MDNNDNLKRPEVRTFKDPQNIVADSKGNIYVSRPVGYISGDKIIKITPDGKAVDFIGCRTKDSRNFNIQNKPTGTINGMTINKNDNIYISSDADIATIKKITPDGELSLVAGPSSGNVSNRYSVLDGKGEAARFYDPDNLTADNTGNLYVVDGGQSNWDKTDKKYGYVIRKITPEGKVTTLKSDTGFTFFLDSRVML